MVLEKTGKTMTGEGAREALGEPESRIQPPHRGFGVLGMGVGDSPLGMGGPRLSHRKPSAAKLPREDPQQQNFPVLFEH